MVSSKFIAWVRNSLLGHIALVEIIGWIPVSAIFLTMFYLDGDLTFSWALYVVFLAALCIAVVGILVWFIFTSPSIKKSRP